MFGRIYWLATASKCWTKQFFLTQAEQEPINTVKIETRHYWPLSVNETYRSELCLDRHWKSALRRQQNALQLCAIRNEPLCPATALRLNRHTRADRIGAAARSLKKLRAIHKQPCIKKTTSLTAVVLASGLAKSSKLRNRRPHVASEDSPSMNV